MDRQGEGGRPCFYEVLGLPRTCSTEDIKRAYRRLAVQHHPDKNPGDEEASAQLFTMIAEAYEVLSDDQKRRVYDSYGRAGVDAHDRGAQLPPYAARPPPSTHGFQADYGFRRAEQIFEAVFGRGNPFTAMHQQMMRGMPGFGGFGNDNDEKEEGDFFGGPGLGMTSSFFGGGGGSGVFGRFSRSLFDNPAAFFSGGGGGLDNSISTAATAASSFTSSSHAAFRGGGGGSSGGSSRYEHSFVRLGLDGTRSLVRQTTVVHADGRREVHVVEQPLGPQQEGWLEGSS